MLQNHTQNEESGTQEQLPGTFFPVVMIVVVVFFVAMPAAAAFVVPVVMMMPAATALVMPVVVMMPAIAVGMMLGFFTGDDDNVTFHGSGYVLELRDQNIRVFRSQPQLLGGKGDDSFLNQGVGIELFFHFGGAVGAAQVFHYVYLFDHGCPPIN
jgi:hypothetical protein